MAKPNYYDYDGGPSYDYDNSFFRVFRAGNRTDPIAIFRSRKEAISACRGFNLDLLHRGELVCPDYVRLEFGLQPAPADLSTYVG